MHVHPCIEDTLVKAVTEHEPIQDWRDYSDYEPQGAIYFWAYVIVNVNSLGKDAVQ